MFMKSLPAFYNSLACLSVVLFPQIHMYFFLYILLSHTLNCQNLCSQLVILKAWYFVILFVCQEGHKVPCLIFLLCKHLAEAIFLQPSWFILPCIVREVKWGPSSLPLSATLWLRGQTKDTHHRSLWGPKFSCVWLSVSRIYKLN